MFIRMTDKHDERRLVARARVRLGHPDVELHVLVPQYEQRLRRVLEHPAVEFVAGFTTPQGSGDALAHYAPGTPEWLARLPNLLLGLEVRVELSVMERAQLYAYWHWRPLRPLLRWWWGRS